MMIWFEKYKKVYSTLLKICPILFMLSWGLENLKFPEWIIQLCIILSASGLIISSITFGYLFIKVYQNDKKINWRILMKLLYSLLLVAFIISWAFYETEILNFIVECSEF